MSGGGFFSGLEHDIQDILWQAKYSQALIVLTLLLFLYPQSSNARGAWSPVIMDPRQSNQYSQAATEDFVEWPQQIGIHSISNVGLTITCRGLHGTGLIGSGIDPEGGGPAPSFIYPYPGDKRYLWGSAIWIGGIVNGDTLVSHGSDSYSLFSNDFQPVGSQGSVFLIGGPADKQFRAVYSDTNTYPAYFEDSMRLKRLMITETSHSWAFPPYDDFVLFNTYIKNISNDTIFQTYVGVYFDADVYSLLSTDVSGRYADDIVGYLDSEGIAYIMDNDGDPDTTYSWHGHSIQGAIGLKLIETEPPAADTNFNWWCAGYSNIGDWGPQFLGIPPGQPHYFQDGLLGTPLGRTDKYYFLAHDETDYDLIQAAIMDESTGWMPLPPQFLNFVYGLDSRFLYSFGPFDINPGDSIHIVYALVGGEQVHYDPENFINNFDPYNPDFFYNQLDFSDLITNAQAAQILYESNFALGLQMGPVQGIRVSEITQTTAEVQWLPRVHPDVIGYNVYLKPVPDSLVIFSDTIVGFRDTTNMILLNTDGPIGDTAYIIDNIQDARTYFVTVTTRTFFSEGPKAPPKYFTFGTPSPPTTNPGPIFLDNVTSVQIHWSPPPDNDISHYNVYRFVGLFEYSQRHHPRTTVNIPIDGREYDSSVTIITDGDTIILYHYVMDPHATVPGVDTTFVDFIENEEVFYIITAVDSLGQESDTSQSIHIFARSQPSKDFLVFLENNGSTLNIESADSIRAFYDEVLSGYEYDFFILSDSSRDIICPNEGCYAPCPNRTCFYWPTLVRYAYILLDENMLKPPLNRYDFLQPFFKTVADYVTSGGHIIYFGPLHDKLLMYDVEFYRKEYQAGAMEYDLLGLDSCFTAGLGLYMNQTIGDVDTVGGFIRAEAVAADFPELNVDTAFYWWNNEARRIQFWPYVTPPLSGSVYPRESGEIIYRYRSLYPQFSAFESMPCGTHYGTPAAGAYVFTFHPWHLYQDDIRLLFKAITGNYSTAVSDESGTLPRQFTLWQNYPNPFNPSTIIRYYLPRAADVSVEIYNILGRKTRTLVTARQKGGDYVVTWDGADSDGNEVASGVYFCRVKAGDEVQTRKMVVLR
ncbi:MAG: T9SS type A sorting domain-containing protein [Candidatus Zixiibacteriota bacterium]|nr:MAG: T9SS type A sorting domain-containing protein [candidate division Zixibacteria bacterium]